MAYGEKDRRMQLPDKERGVTLAHLTEKSKHKSGCRLGKRGPHVLAKQET
jgi:hypothetical protein